MYIGPEIMMPLASAVAAAAGFLLMFWRRTLEFVRSVVQAVTSKIARR